MVTTVATQRCFHKPEKIITIDGVDYYAADEDGITYFEGDVVFNLTKTPNLPSSAFYPEFNKHFNLPFKEVMVPWPDFGLPMVKLSFWQALHKVVKRKRWKTVCIHCGHGHGRTGTAMSSLLIANLGYTPIEAVDTIRTRHCAEAVETSEQCNYLMEVDMHYNGREPLEENYPPPSMMFNWDDYEVISSEESTEKDS